MTNEEFEDIVTKKNILIMEILDMQIEPILSTDIPMIRSYSLEAAKLEMKIAQHLIDEGKAEEGIINYTSSGYLYTLAGKKQKAKKVYNEVLPIALAQGNKHLESWVTEELKKFA